MGIKLQIAKDIKNRWSFLSKKQKSGILSLMFLLLAIPAGLGLTVAKQYINSRAYPVTPPVTGPNLACNEICQNEGDCSSGYICYNDGKIAGSHCRNIHCLNQTNCICPTDIIYIPTPTPKTIPTPIQIINNNSFEISKNDTSIPTYWAWNTAWTGYNGRVCTVGNAFEGICHFRFGKTFNPHTLKQIIDYKYNQEAQYQFSIATSGYNLATRGAFYIRARFFDANNQLVKIEKLDLPSGTYKYDTFVVHGTTPSAYKVEVMIVFNKVSGSARVDFINLVMSQPSTPSPTPIVSPSPTPIPTPTPTATVVSSPTPTATAVPSPTPITSIVRVYVYYYTPRQYPAQYTHVTITNVETGQLLASGDTDRNGYWGTRIAANTEILVTATDYGISKQLNTGGYGTMQTVNLNYSN